MNRDRTRRSDAQMGVDFLTGMTIFIFSLFFVLQFMFGMVEPYTSTSTEHVGTADRISERLISDQLADEDDPSGIINHTKTVRFFNKSDDKIEEALGVPRATGFRITVTADDVTYPPTDDLIGYWSFNRKGSSLVPDTANIDSGEGAATGRLVGFDNGTAPERGVDGLMSSNALGFDLSDKHVEVPTTTRMNLSTIENYSISLWFRDVQTSADGALFGIHNASEDYVRLFVHGSSEEPRFRLEDSDSNACSGFGDIHREDEWTHLTLVHNNTTDTAKLYQNAELVATESACNQNYVNGSSTVFIGGAGPDWGMVDFNGSIDEVRYYDRYLTPDEVEALYNASGVLSPDEPNVTTHTGLNDTRLVAGGTVPDVASVSSRRRAAHIPTHNVKGVEDHVVGPVEVRVQVW